MTSIRPIYVVHACGGTCEISCGARLARWSVSSEGFGKFMCDILFADGTENYAKAAREVAAKTANPAKTANL